MKKGIAILVSMLLLCSAVFAVEVLEYTVVPGYIDSVDMPIITFQCNDGWDNDGDHRIDYFGGCDSDKDGWIDYVCGCDTNYDDNIGRSEALVDYDDCFLAEFGCMVNNVFDNDEICADGNLYWPDLNCTDFIDNKERTLDGEEEAQDIIEGILAIEPDFPNYEEPNFFDNIEIIPYYPYWQLRDEIQVDVTVEGYTPVERNVRQVETTPIQTPNRGILGYFVFDIIFDHPLNKLK